jgi:hypothetical protein
VPNDRNNLTAVLNVRLTAGERAAVAENAETAGLTISAYCRRLIFGRTVHAHTDTAVIREMRRLGGLLKAVHTESGGAYSASTAAALADLREAIGRIAQ